MSSSPALDQHLDLDVVGDHVLVDDQALEVEVGLGRRGEADLDLLEPDVDQRLEQRQLALGVHRVDQGLVAVAQVDAGPARGPGELAVGPGAVVQDERDVRPVLVERHRRRVAGQGQVTPLHVVTTPSLSLSHQFLPFSSSLDLSTRTGTGPTKNPLACRRRRLRANAMWRSPSGKQQVGRDRWSSSRVDCPIGCGGRQGRGCSFTGEPNLSRLPSGSVWADSQTPNPGSNRSCLQGGHGGPTLPVVRGLHWLDCLDRSVPLADPRSFGIAVVTAVGAIRALGPARGRAAQRGAPPAPSPWWAVSTRGRPVPRKPTYRA
jgi:hypothetical protein